MTTVSDLKADRDAIRRRLDDFAQATGTTAPREIVDADDCLTPELLTYCRQEGANLDWLTCGDVRGLTALARDLPERKRHDSIEVLFMIWRSAWQCEVRTDADFEAKCELLADMQDRIVGLPDDTVRALQIKVVVADGLGYPANAHEELVRRTWAALDVAMPNP